MVCDYVRSCYIGTMKIWQDREETIEVRWFFTKPGAKLLPGPHPWGSAFTWENKDFPSPNYPGESGYVKYDKGANPLGYMGTDHCGGKDAVREGGLASRDPVITTGPNGYADCCGPIHLVCGDVAWPGPVLVGKLQLVGDHCPCLVPETDWVLNYAPGFAWELPDSEGWISDYRSLSACPGSCGAPSRLRWGVSIRVPPADPCETPQFLIQWEGQHPVTCAAQFNSDATKRRSAEDYSFSPFTGFVQFGYGGLAGNLIFAEQSPATPALNCNVTGALSTWARFSWEPPS